MGCRAEQLFTEGTGELGWFWSRRFRDSLSLLGPRLLHLYLATVGASMAGS